MSENTFINGWNIRQGDYVSIGDYKKAYPDVVINRKRRTKIMFLLYNTIGLGGILIILSILSKI